MDYSRKDVDATKAKSRKKFVHYEEDAEMYSMCETKFIRKRQIASTLTFLGGCLAATNI